MSSSVHIENKSKDISIFDEGPTQGLDDTTLTVEGKCPINFTQSRKIFALSLHHMGATISYLLMLQKSFQSKRL